MNICIFGDSITWGSYDPVNSGWANSLRHYLEEKYDEVITYTLGICGEDTTGLLKRFSNESQTRTPSVIIIAIGANDIKHQPGISVPFEVFRENISQIMDQAKRFTSKVIVLGITPVDEALTTPRNKPPYNFRENKDVIVCNRILEEIAVHHNFVFVSIPNDFTVEDLCDGLHPNSNGHKKIYETIKTTVEKMVLADQPID